MGIYRQKGKYKMSTKIEELNKKLELVPDAVKKDVKKRVLDWTSSGGDPESGYIDQQLRYVDRYLS